MTASRNRGELESDIMNILWQSTAALTAKEVQGLFSSRVPAITTLITVLDRMRAKGDVVKHASGGRSFTFAPTRSRVDHVTSVMNSALLSADDHVAALLMFAGTLSDDDRAFLRQAIDTAK